jgi:hypothetical protein
MTSESMRRSVRWPKVPNALGSALSRMASNLRAAGIEIQFSRVLGEIAPTYFFSDEARTRIKRHVCPSRYSVAF